MNSIEKNQSHLIPFTQQSAVLAAQLEQLDWREVNSAIDQCINTAAEHTLPKNYEPAEYFPLAAENDEHKRLYTEASELGQKVIRQGKVAAFTVAGGQGTRLGYDAPKGTLPVSPIKKKSLFQLFAEQISGQELQYDCCIPWYIMCSPLNLQSTTEFFEENKFFGLDKNNVKFFAQGVMPATDFKGKLLLSDKDSLAFSPNGHGGSLKALIDSGAIADMKTRGIEHISYFQVDNPMISIINPLFIGLHELQQSDMSNRSLTKTGPFEKLGNFVRVGDRISIIEYSDLPEEKALQKDAQGRIQYRAGSPAIHLLRRDFIEKFANDSLSLPYHRAEKKVPFINSSGELIKPEQANAVKFETFVFDALALAKNALILEADRLEEFSPVKNKTGIDSLESSQRDQSLRAKKWLKEIAVQVPDSCTIELSPKSFPCKELLSQADLPQFEVESTYYIP